MKSIDENYSISECGLVYSKPRLGTSGGFLKPFINPTGYYVVMLAPSRRPSKIHRLVATAFLDNPDSLPQVNHKDGNKLNNHRDNLEWCSARHNVIHAFESGLCNPCKGERHRLARLTDEDVRYIRSVYVPYSKEFGSRALGKKLNIHHTNVSRAATSSTWTHV